jgi:hypothetical protein
VRVMERRSCFSTFLFSARVLMRSAARFAISFISLSSANCSWMLFRGLGGGSAANFVFLVLSIEFLVIDLAGT